MIFKRSPKPPTDRPFVHADNCLIVRSDPTVTIEWQEVETGKWQRICQCGTEFAYDQEERARVNPYDPASFRHAPQCEYRDATDPAIIRAIISWKDGATGGYLWVTCGHCEISWPVPDFQSGEEASRA